MLHLMIPLLVAMIGAGPEGDSVKAVVRGNTQFALALYGKTRGQAGNLFFSPYSISSALAMTHAGANGETADQMASTLHLPSDQELLDAGFSELDAAIFASNAQKSYQLEIANALWGQSGLDYHEDFLKRTEKAYHAGLHPLDFAANPEASRLAINQWVEQQTHERIKDLLGPGSVHRDTDLILTNAIYFKAAWSKTFNKSATRDEDFNAPTGKVAVPMMTMSNEFRYLEAENGLQILDLPYQGGALSMVFLLPRETDGLEPIEAGLSVEKLEGWMSQLDSTRMVNVALPRFKIERSLDLGETLKSLGMTRAFGSQADFSGITTSRHLAISDVVHKAFVNVNEEGTEAAAASAVMMARTSVMVPFRPPVVFRADHPFLFFIRDVRSATILFLGRVVNPRG
jgi:serpin B